MRVWNKKLGFSDFYKRFLRLNNKNGHDDDDDDFRGDGDVDDKLVSAPRAEWAFKLWLEFSEAISIISSLESDPRPENKDSSLSWLLLFGGKSGILIWALGGRRVVIDDPTF